MDNAPQHLYKVTFYYNLIMWKKITEEHPPKNRVMMTKIKDESGTRNEQELKFDGKLWWMPDGSMYVYYTPTHWKCWV